MLFNFRLAPLEKITPWKNHNQAILHWFGLTDGCYWLDLDGVELFRANQSHLLAQNIQYDCNPYVDYQVARLWEDLLGILPDVLLPVPKSLAEKSMFSELSTWLNRAFQWLEDQNNNSLEISETIYEDALEWCRRHFLPTNHLHNHPIIWLWSDQTHVHIAWDNTKRKVDGVPVWDAQVGSRAISIEQFLEEVRTFDRQFIQAMQGRVEQIMANWNRPDILLDMSALRQEQAHRAIQVEQVLSKYHQRQVRDWQPIIEAVSLIDTQLRQ